MSLGWGNQMGRDATERALQGEGAFRGRLGVLAVAVLLLVVGLITGNPFIWISCGIATALAVVSLVRAVAHDRAIRRLERRHLPSPPA